MIKSYKIEYKIIKDFIHSYMFQLFLMLNYHVIFLCREPIKHDISISWGFIKLVFNYLVYYVLFIF